LKTSAKLDILDDLVVLNSVVKINKRGYSLWLHYRSINIASSETADSVDRRPSCQNHIFDVAVSASLAQRSPKESGHLPQFRYYVCAEVFGELTYAASSSNSEVATFLDVAQGCRLA
jgi:hypothetical protein